METRAVRYFTREQTDVLQEFLQLVVEQDELRLFLGTLGEERRRLGDPLVREVEMGERLARAA